MKNIFAFIMILFILSSCDKKKLIEVEVPLPEIDSENRIGNPSDVVADNGFFKLEKLNFSYAALSPQISAATIETHYSKHYLAYTNNLNRILKETSAENNPIEKLLKTLDTDNEALRNNAGGYYNHSLYFKCLSSKEKRLPKDTLAIVIENTFGSFSGFESKFKQETSKVFGSGWTWLIVNKNNELQICSTANQDNPLMKNSVISGTPILGIDLWEHAYYLDYKNKRADYVNSFFDKINWEAVEILYENAIQK